MTCLYHLGYFRQSEDEENIPEEKIKEHERTHSISCVSCTVYKQKMEFLHHVESSSCRILIYKRTNPIKYVK